MFKEQLVDVVPHHLLLTLCRSTHMLCSHDFHLDEGMCLFELKCFNTLCTYHDRNAGGLTIYSDSQVKTLPVEADCNAEAESHAPLSPLSSKAESTSRAHLHKLTGFGCKSQKHYLSVTDTKCSFACHQGAHWLGSRETCLLSQKKRSNSANSRVRLI